MCEVIHTLLVERKTREMFFIEMLCSICVLEKSQAADDQCDGGKSLQTVLMSTLSLKDDLQ